MIATTQMRLRFFQKTIRDGQCPSYDHVQNWLVLKGKANHAIWYRGTEQTLRGFPERIDIHRGVQAKQRLFECRLDHRFAFHADPWRSLHYGSSSRDPSFVCAGPWLPIPEMSNNRRSKKAT